MAHPENVCPCHNVSMKLCLDVQYTNNQALSAGILFQDWSEGVATRAVTLPIANVAPYEPGVFYKRELPCLLALLETISEPIDLIVVHDCTPRSRKKFL
jgi:deoxyribonuclease V